VTIRRHNREFAHTPRLVLQHVPDLYLLFSHFLI
jgi:hypothetical protein